ncbi:TetR/AcrR family transcriptional regulator [Actinomadura bangladeshensis]|uniref:TetR/AcrR family transcriptional regulator n=1 Tax=Actinomadura bangladeshensis TaxID=453573 RepID=A0A4V2XN99_9ACTN|nr:TetR family transcriptional regulator [Actinomadura bangladeshensis]TDC17376.1 TetR/AcrR family transcriptional regulator [Actinomadura bangladeshensis]
MRKTARRHQQGEESRLRILEATLAIAAERGYDGTSIALVTEATGLPASSVYWHFRNKDELLAETLEFSYRRWRETAPTWQDRVGIADPAEEIRDRLHRASRAITERPEFWRLGLMLGLANRPKEPAARRRYIEVRAETRTAIRDWWEQVLPAGAPGADRVADRLSRFHLAVMDGLYIGVHSSRDWDLDRLVDLIADGVHAQALAWLADAA